MTFPCIKCEIHKYAHTFSHYIYILHLHMATSFFYIYVMATSFFYIYVMATSFFYFYVMATSFFYIYKLTERPVVLLNAIFTVWKNILFSSPTSYI